MTYRSGVSSQNISRTDILAEGPVRGLKNGASSIFFNDVASEDANVRGYNPIEGTASGKITFDGTSLTNTSITGATLPTNLVNPTGAPRQLVLKDYRTTDVTVVDASTEGTGFSVFTCTAASGTPFTTDWNTASDYKTTAYLKAEGLLVKGQFLRTSSTVGSFTFFGVSDAIDTTKTYELRISVGFYIDSINSSTSLTLKSSYSGISGQTPAAGTYFFEIPPLQTRNTPRGNGYPPSKVEGIEVEFRPGHRYQDPLNEIGGVGGSVAATTSVDYELKVIGTGEISGINPVPEDGTIGNTMESGLPLDSQDDVASDATVLNDTAFGITAAQRPEVDEISLRITYPGGLQYINSEKGKRSTSYARYLIEIQTTLDGVDSEWENAFPNSQGYVGHQGRTNAAYSFDHVLGLNQYRPFDSFKIRVIRLTRHIGLRVEESGHGNGVTNREKWTLIAKSKIDQLGYVIKDRLSYPYTSLISTSFSSKQYQQPPKMSYLMQGLKVKVPSSYTPREYSPNGVAQYESFWNGTFKDELQYTDNPAWVFYDIVTNNRYGAGRWIKESDVDKYALYNIAKYCDELVDDGAGGTEPRFRSNIFLTKATDVYKVLKDFASSFTAMVYWLDGQVTAVQDVSKDPIYTFSKSNIIDGKFAYESSGLKTRSNQIVVTWNDPKSNYEPVPLIVEDREAIVRDKRLIPQEVVAFGCTSEAQAIRFGRWKLWTAQKQTEVVSFKSALNSLYIKPGDIINVQDADRQGAVYSGRVSSATSTSVTLDRTVNLRAGSTYTLSTLVISNGEYSIEENEVTNSSGSTSTLNVSGFTNTPSASTIWALKETKDGLTVSGSYKQYKVLSITQDKSNEYGFSAVEHYDEKYTYIDSGYTLAELAETIYEEVEIRDGETEMPGPSNLRLVLETDATRPGEEFKLEWDPSTSDFVDLYEIHHNIEDTESPLRTSGTFARFTNVPNGSITFNVRAVSTGGNYSPFISFNYVSTDPYGTNIDRVQYGIPKGIRSTSESGIVFKTEDNPDGATQIDGDGTISVIQIERPYYVFLQASPVVSSNGNLDESVTLIENEQDISEMVNDEDHYVFKTGNSLSLYYYDTSAMENMPFWRDVGAGFRARIFGAQTSLADPTKANTVMTSAWTSIGSCTISGNVLTGSNFTSSLQLRDILSLTGGNIPGKITSMGNFVVGEEYIITSLEDSDFTTIGAESNTEGLSFIATGTGTGGGAGTAKKVDRGAEVISIVDANTAILDRSLDLGTSSRTVYRATYRPDYENDAAIARVKRTGGESDFEYSNFVQIDPNLGTPKSILVNVDPSILTYDVTNTQTNVPNSIAAEVFAIGFSDPEFFMELPDRSDPLEDDELNGTESTEYVPGETTDRFKKLFTLNGESSVGAGDGGEVAYAASDLIARFLVREKNDPSKQVTRQISIPRRKDAASAVLELSNDNVTVFANTTNQDATISEECVLTVFRGNEDVTDKFDLSASGAVAVGAGSNGDIEGSFGTGNDINKFTVSTLKQTFTSGSISFTATGKAIANGGSEEFDGITLPSKTMSISVSSAEGSDAVVYRVEPSVTAVTYDIDSDTLTPATSTGIRFDAYKTVGTEAPTTYSDGGFKIYLDTNTGTNTAYASSSAESYVEFTGYSSSNDLITVKLFRDSALTELVDTETVPIISSGTSGEDAKFLRLKTNHQVFVRSKDGTIAPSTIEFTAEKVNLASGTNVTWSSAADLYANPTDTSPITQSSFTGTTVYLKSSSVSGATTSVTVTAQAIENSVTYTDTESVERVDDGSDAITISLSNENVTLTADNDGTVPSSSFSGSGTNIIVREGSDVLDYDASGTTAGHWTVSTAISPSIQSLTIGNISASSGTDDRYAILSNATAMSSSDDEATITFTIEGKKLDGTSFSETKVQTFSKAKAGDAGQDGGDGEDSTFLRLKTNHQVFVKRKNGSIEPDAITFTAEKINLSGTVNWTTSPSTTLYTAASGGSATTTGDVVYLRKASVSSNTSISVTATVTNSEGTFSDTETVERVDEGSDAITVSLSNDNVTFTADNSGTVPSGAYTGSGTTITVREGSNVLDYDASGTTAGHWTVATPTVNPLGGITVGSISQSGDLAVVADASNMSSGDDNVAVTYTVSGKKLDGTPFSEDKIQTFSKAEAGDPGDPGAPGDPGDPGDPAIQVSATNLTHTFIAGTNGIVSNNNFSCSFNLSQGGTAFTYAGSGTTANTFGITISSPTNCSVTNTSGSLTIDATSNILDTASVTNASFVVTLFDRGNSNATIASYTINLSKINQALRDGGTFTFTGYDGTYAAAWAGTLTSSSAQAVAQSVINNSSDGFITPNDKITVSGTLSGVTYAATRVYTGTRTNASSSVGTSSFSSVVTEIFDGSVIVNGTLSAETLAADTTLTNNIIIGDRLQIGTTNSPASGIINSVNKTTFSDTDAGFYFDGSGDVLIGNATNFFKFDASEGDFTLSGNVTIQGPGGLSATLTRENAQAPCDNDGSNPVLTNTATTFKVFVGNTEVSLQKNTDSNPTADFLISRSKSPDNTNWQYNISSDGATITPTTLNVDEATVTFTATPRSGGDYADYPSISKTYTITKVPEGAAITGDEGESLDIIFKRSSSQPTTPSPSASTPSGWVTNVNSTTGTNLLWASVGTKASGATNYTWQTPYQVEGTAVAEVAAYRLNNSTRSDTGSYNFTTSTLTPPTDWSVGPPSITTDGDIVYVIVGTASGSPTATAASITWSSAAVYARQNNGDPGDPGSAFFQITSDDNTVPASKITAAKINSAIGRNYAVTGDICVVTASNGSTSAAYKYSDNDGDSSTYSTGNWSTATAFINGDLVVNGGITAEKLSLGQGGLTGSIMKLYEDGIDIYDTGDLRVRIGNLNPSGRT